MEGELGGGLADLLLHELGRHVDPLRRVVHAHAGLAEHIEGARLLEHHAVVAQHLHRGAMDLLLRLGRQDRQRLEGVLETAHRRCAA